LNEAAEQKKQTFKIVTGRHTPFDRTVRPDKHICRQKRWAKRHCPP